MLKLMSNLNASCLCQISGSASGSPVSMVTDSSPYNVIIPAVKCKSKVDIAFLVDSSGSIGRRNWRKIKIFIITIIQQITVSSEGNHVAVIMFSTSAEVVFKFNTLQGSSVTVEEYSRLIDGMYWQRGWNFMDKALILAKNEIFTFQGGMRQHVPKVRIFPTIGITQNKVIVLS